MQFAYEALKLTASASEMVDEPEWFDVIAEVLMVLDSITISLGLVHSWFYIRYSALLGHELGLWRDINGEELKGDDAFRYDISEKGLRAIRGGELTSDHIKLLRLMSVKSLKALAQVGGIDDVLGICLSVSRSHASI